MPTPRNHTVRVPGSTRSTSVTLPSPVVTACLSLPLVASYRSRSPQLSRSLHHRISFDRGSSRQVTAPLPLSTQVFTFSPTTVRTAPVSAPATRSQLAPGWRAVGATARDHLYGAHGPRSQRPITH